MKLIVISDTHIPQKSKTLPNKIIEEIKNADAVIHAGDFTSYDFYEQLKFISKQLYAVKGNMDDRDITNFLPNKLIIKIEEKTIGIMHGFGPPHGLEEYLLKNFEKDKIDILIYGHSHKSIWKKKDSIYILNPGSPTDYVFTKEQTYAVLNIEKEIINADIIKM